MRLIGMLQAAVTVAIAWRFTQLVLPGRVAPDDHPALRTFSARAEALPEFVATPPV